MVLLCGTREGTHNGPRDARNAKLVALLGERLRAGTVRTPRHHYPNGQAAPGRARSRPDFPQVLVAEDLPDGGCGDGPLAPRLELRQVGAAGDALADIVG